MKAVATDSGVETLSVRELPGPEPAAGEVRVRVRTSALNPADGKVLRGEFVGNVLHGKRRPIAVKSVRPDLDRLAQWVAEGMKVPIDSTFPVAQLPQALDRQARGGMKGRVVITVEGGFGA